MRFEFAYERAVLAFGAQSAIDLPQCRFGDAHDDGLAYALQGGGHFGADTVEGHAVGVRIRRFHHVDEVHVGYVVEFACAELAHADDGEAHVFAAVHFVAGDGERAFQGRVGKIGQFLADSRLYFDWVVRGGVLRHDGGKLFPVGLSQGSRRLRKGFRGFRHAIVGRVGTDRFEDMRAALRVVVQVAFA